MNIEEETSCQIKAMRENFKFLREIRGWSITQLAALSGIEESILKNIETGKNFEIVYILKLCSFYGIVPYKIFMDRKNNSKSQGTVP